MASRRSSRSARSTTSRCGCSSPRGRPPVDTLTALAGSRMAIGAEGSGTRALALQLLRRRAASTRRPRRSCRSAARSSSPALDAGEVDVVFQVARHRGADRRRAAAPARPAADEPRARARVCAAHCPSHGADGAARRRRPRRRPARPRHHDGRRHDGQSPGAETKCIRRSCTCCSTRRPRSTAAMRGWPRRGPFPIRAGRTCRSRRKRSATTSRASRSSRTTCRTGRRISSTGC